MEFTRKIDRIVKRVEHAIPGQVDDKLFGTIGAATSAITSLAPGIVLDAARALPGVELEGGAWDHFSTKHTLSSIGDLLVGEGTLTGYLIGGTGKALDAAYRYGVEDNIEAPLYRATGAGSWSQAYQIARKRNLGQTIVQGAAALHPNPSDMEVQNWLDPEQGFAKFAQSTGHATGMNVAAGVVGIVPMFYLDPSIAALRVGGAVNTARKGLQGARTVGWTHMIGEAVDTGKVTAGKANLDGELVERAPIYNFKPGHMDSFKNEREVLEGLNLPQDSAEANLLATYLYRTNEITDPLKKVHTRNALLLVAHGDASGYAKLQGLDKSAAYTLSNLARNRGSGAIEAAKADSGHLLDILNGTADMAMHSPEMVAGVQDELMVHPDFKALWASVGGKPAVKRGDWRDRLAESTVERLTGDRVVGPSPFMETARGNRAVARIRGEGLGRNGALRTGHAAFDERVGNSWVAKPLRAFFVADPWTPAAQIVRGGFKEITWADVGRLTGQSLLYSTGLAPAARGLARTSNSLRSIRVYGSLNLEDPNLSAAAVGHQLRIAGMDPERANGLVSSVIRAPTATHRAMAVQRAQDAAIAHVAKTYGIDEGMARTIARGGQNYVRGIKNVVNQQQYAAIQSSVNSERLADGRPLFYGPAVVPDAEGATVFIPEGPILKSQQVNSMELMDMERVVKWLKHDRYISALSRRLHSVVSHGPTDMKYVNPLRAGFQKLGYDHLYRDQAVKDWTVALGDAVDRSNSLWKQMVLGLRLGSYAIRNTAEEQMRVWALGYASATREARRAQRPYLTATGKVKALPAVVQERVDSAQVAYDNTAELLADPGVRRAIRAHEKAMAKFSKGETKVMPQPNEDVLRYNRLERELGEHAEELKFAREAADNWRPFAGRQTMLIGGQEYDVAQAEHGGEGRQFSDLLNSSASGFDTAERDAHLERLFTRTHGRLIDQSPSLSISAGDKDAEYVTNYFGELAHIVNHQFEDDAAKVVINGMAKGHEPDMILSDVREWLGSPAAREYRRHNPIYARDLDTWASTITDLVHNTVATRELAVLRSKGEVDIAALRKVFGDYRTAPDVHRATGSLMFSTHGQIVQKTISQTFSVTDRASLQRWTRHPMFHLYFNDALERRLTGWHDLVKSTRGEDAVVSSKEIETLQTEARREALHNIKRTFYDAHSRSGAAHQLRFVFPFFAAHQDSVRFWGSALGEDPSVFRKMQLGFETPRNMGIVVDQTGKPKGFNDPVDPMHDAMITPLPAFLGGEFQIPLSSAMLILQQGSILNPGAGPMAAIPAAYFQKHLASRDEEIDRALKFFNPYGAPKNEGLDQALATPIKRFRDAIEATAGGQDSADMVHLLNTRLIDAYVEYRNQNDGKIPSQKAWAEIADKQSAMVRGGAMMRLVTSVGFPFQPQPTSEYHALLAEYRRLSDKGRKEGKGVNWATDEFIKTYGETYYALTQSQSANRGHVPPTARALATLHAYPRLRNQTSLDSWGLIVGTEGEGSFSMNAYRAMQQVAMKKSTPEKLSEALTPEDLFQRIKVGEGWMTYNKQVARAMADSKDRGFLLADNDPEYTAQKKQIRQRIEEENPVWADLRYQTRVPFGKLLGDAALIAADPSLSKDPGRSDIRYMGAYLSMRREVQHVLDQRAKNGIKGGGTITSKANQDLLYEFNKRIAAMAQSNEGFREHVIPNLVYKDPFYDEDIAGAKVGDQ